MVKTLEEAQVLLADVLLRHRAEITVAQARTLAEELPALLARGNGEGMLELALGDDKVRLKLVAERHEYQVRVDPDGFASYKRF